MRRRTLYVILSILVLIFSAILGPMIERKHYRDIKRREQLLAGKPTVTFGVNKLRGLPPIKKAELVTGEIVIGADFFSCFIAKINKFFGWRLPGFERLLDRGRREAILRMKENAKDANIIVNTRIETTRVNKNASGDIGNSQCSIVAYGTAITYDWSSFSKKH